MSRICRMAALALTLMVASPAASWAAGEQFTLNLNQVDIRTLIDTVADATGKNFILDPAVRGQVTVVSGRPMGSDELYRVFLSILEIHGFATVPGDQVIKIVPKEQWYQPPAKPA